MRQSPNGRRPRGRSHGPNGGGGHNGGGHSGGGHSVGPGNGSTSGPMNNPNSNRPRSIAALRHQNFDSNCIDVRVRGNAWQVYEKYQALARDAQSASDFIAAENYQQHAEHYFRLIQAFNEAMALEQKQQVSSQPYSGNRQPDYSPRFYGADGQPQPGQGTPPSEGQPNAQPQMAEAQVQRPSQQPSPFYTAEEVEEAQGEAPPRAVGQ